MTVGITERQFQAQVELYATARGFMVYHTHDSRRSHAGWPDLVLCKPETRQLAFVELKSEHGRVTPGQAKWLRALHDCGMKAGVFRPSTSHELFAWLDEREEF